MSLSNTHWSDFYPFSVQRPLPIQLSLFIALLSSTCLSQAQQAITAVDEYLAYNDEDYAISELNYLADIPLISAATRLPQQRHESPAAITVIDRAVIDASSALTIPDLFRFVPGMMAYNTSANTSAVAYHGMSDKFPSQMEVMVDGRSIYLPLLSTVIWDTLGLTVDDVDRIEVVRGSNSATHGSNAFIGAINIITRSGLSKPGSSIKYTLGSLNTQNFEARHKGSYSLGNFALSAGNLSNDGTSKFKDDATRKYLNFNTVITPNLQDTLTLNLGVSEGYTNIGDIDSTPDLTQRTYHTNSQHIKWQRILQDEAEVEIQYSHNYYNLEAPLFDVAAVQRALSPSLTPAQAEAFIVANPVRQTSEVGDIEQHDIEMTWRKQISPVNQFVIGGGYKFDQARSLELLDTTDWISEERTRIFSNWEYSGINDWVFNTGAMVEQATAGDSNTRISPRLAANYQLTDTSGLRSSVSQAYRMPSLLEANMQNIIRTPSFLPSSSPSIYTIETLANPDIEPERLQSLDIGYFKNWPEYNSQMDLRIFYERIDNGISTTFKKIDNPASTAGGDTRYRTEINGAEWNNRGFETQLRYQPNIEYSPLILFNYSYIHVRGFRNRGFNGSGTTDEIDRLENRTPMHTASLLASVTLPKNLQLSISHFYMSEVQWLEGSGNVPNRQYNRTDIKISKGFKYQSGSELKVNFLVHNLLDDPYPEFYADNLFDRRAYMQMELSF